MLVCQRGNVVVKKTKMLKKNYEFRKVLTKGKPAFGKYIVVFVYKNKKQLFNFLGLAISAKTCKSVRRNRLKRLIRESYYFYENQMTVGNNMVFLWNKKADPKNVGFHDIKKDMERILHQSEVL